MKKIFLLITISFVLASFVIIPSLTYGQKFNPKQGLVPCGKAADGSDACTILDFFAMLAIIYDFIVWWIVTPLATLALTIGGIFILISAGNPNLLGTGKKIVYAAIIGLVLVWGSWLIINLILVVMGYSMGKLWYQL